MSTVMESPATGEATQSNSELGSRLRSDTTAVRVHIRWPGTRKSLSESQRSLAAEAFAADQKSVSAAKKLLDTSHPAFKAVTTVKTAAVNYWRDSTLPFVEPGMRLIRRQQITEFNERMTEYREQLAIAVSELEQHFDELVQQARQRLGDLFNASDYPADIADAFAIEWDFPSVSTPEYLRSVSPDLYEAECQRVRARFDEAVSLAENAFAEELAQLVTHLAERLSGGEDGQPKVFRDSAVNNLREFFDRFRRLNIRSDDDLERLVTDAESVIAGVSPQGLRDRQSLRQAVNAQLREVTESLDDWMTDRPRRNILRRAR
jgi:hypothetical protein